MRVYRGSYQLCVCVCVCVCVCASFPFGFECGISDLIVLVHFVLSKVIVLRSM